MKWQRQINLSISVSWKLWKRDETDDSVQSGIVTIVVKNAFSGLNEDHLRKTKLLQKPLVYSHISNHISYRENVIPHY